MRLILLLLVLLASAGTARTVAAHAVLLETQPADGAVLAVAPDQVTLRFNEPVTPIVVRLLDRSGVAVTGTAAVRSDGGTIRVALPVPLADGPFLLSYRVTSADSHPVAGSLFFHVGAGAAEAAVVAQVAGSAVPWQRFAPINRAIWVSALFVGLGGALFLGLLQQAAATAPGLPRIVGAALAIALAGSLVGVGLQGALLLDAGGDALADFETWKVGLNTTRGTASLAAAAGLLLILLSLSGLGRRRRRALVLAGALVTVVSFGLSGHVATAQPGWFAVPAVVLHVALAMLWIGALAPLLVVVRNSPENGAAALRAFSRWALPGVLLLIVAGLSMAVIQVVDPAALLETTYGALLLAKSGVVVVLMGLAATNRWFLVPRLARDPRRVEALRATITAEILLALAVLTITTFLAQTAPPRVAAMAHHHGAGVDDGVTIATFSRGRLVLVSVSPAIHGPNTVSVEFSDRAGGALLPMEATVELSLPALGIEPVVRTLVADPSGSYRYRGTEMVLPGLWTVRIDALVSDFEKMSVAVEVPLR